MKMNETLDTVTHTHTHTHGFLKNKNKEVKIVEDIKRMLEVRKKEKNSNIQPLTSNINKNTAITLIALVITIVVLVIIASVAINLSLGNNGIFNKAKYSKEKYLNAKYDEETELAKAKNEIDSSVDGTRTTPTSSSQTLNSSNYSSTEQLVGKWIDGKPLYQITYSNTTPNAVNTDKVIADISSLEYETVFISNCFYVCSDGAVIDGNAPMGKESYNFTRIWGSGKIACKVTNDVAVSRPIYVTIQYTKKADSAS